MLKLSVVIPVYNAEKYIARCLDSVLNQSEKEIEIICIDDGSTDDSLNILMKYKNENKNISVYTQENSFAGVARNLGISKATGEYIHFLDIDDYILPGTYSSLLEYAGKIQVDIIKFRSCVYDDTSKEVLPYSGYDLRNINPDLFGKKVSINENMPLFISLSPVPWGYIIKREFVEKNKMQFNKLKCVNDRSFYCDAITHAQYISFYDDYIVMHKINDKGSLAGGRRSRENFICVIKSCQIIFDNIKNMPIEVKRAVLNFEFKSLAADFSFLDQDVKDIYISIIWEEVYKKYITYLSDETLKDQFVRKLFAMIA